MTTPDDPFVVTWAELRVQAEARLRDANALRPDTEARWMVERVSGYEGTELVTDEQERATTEAQQHLDDMLERRVGGEPLQYVLGRWDFLGLDLLVDRRVLVPRPETEVVAQTAIEEAARLGARRGKHDAWLAADTSYAVADLGTGSAAIALVLARELPDAEVLATDVSDDALAVARANVAGSGTAATRVRLHAGSWYHALPPELRGRLRVIVSNPPYIAEHEVAELPSEVVDWEPRSALVSGPTGFEALEVLIARRAGLARPGRRCARARARTAPGRARARTRSRCRVHRVAHRPGPRRSRPHAGRPSPWEAAGRTRRLTAIASPA